MIKKVESASGESKVDLLIELGLQYDRSGEYNNSMSCFVQALNLSKQLKDSLRIAESIHNIGMVWDTRGDFDLALKYYSESLVIYEKINNLKGRINSLLGIANIHRLRYNFDDGIVVLQKADSLSAISNDKSLAFNTSFHFGIFYLRLNDFQKSTNYLNKALILSQETGNRNGEARVLGYLGVLCSMKKEFAKSNEYYNKSLQIREQINDIAGIASSINNIGENYLDSKDFNTALKYFFKSYELRKQTQNKYGVAQSQKNIGKTFIPLKRYDEALTYLNESNKFAIKENILQIQIENYYLISEAYRLKNNYQEAYKNFRIYFQLKDSVSISDFNKRINDLLQKVELKKQETEIARLKNNQSEQALKLNTQNYQILLLFSIAVFLTILTLVLLTKSRLMKKHQKDLEDKNDEISAQKIELEELIAMKDKFFTIIAHDLKNPFNSLLGFSTILHDEFNNLTDAEKFEIVKDLKNSSFSSFKLLQNLLDWSRTQTGRIDVQISEFSIMHAIQEVCDIHRSIYENKNLTIDLKVVDDIKIKSDVNIFKTIIRNIFSNAIKFTQHNGKIDIIAYKTDVAIKVEIIDNGTGMDVNTLINLFDISKQSSRCGTDDEKGTGLGLILCKEFVTLLGGTIEVESKLGEGSIFKITIPLMN